MEFRTIVTPSRCENKIDHNSRIMTFGSCFAKEIADRLQKRLFKVYANPFGTLYNPASIKFIIERIISAKEFESDEIFQSGRLFHNFLCHSSCSDTDKKRMLATLNAKLNKAHHWLCETDIVLLTFGTAWVFEDKTTGRVVANCHKLPSDRFNRRMMDTDECCEQICDCLSLIRAINPDCRIILTVSPIRHMADGAHGNALSKSTLLLSIDKSLKSYPNIEYFPSYEILLDDLRDYRFYGPDMCHPSAQAADYIFQRFGETYFANETVSLSDRCMKLTRRFGHKPLSPDYDAFKLFKMDTEKLVCQLLTEHPYLNEAIEELKYQQ